MNLISLSRIAVLICALSATGIAAFAQAPAKKAVAAPTAAHCAVTDEKIGDPKQAHASKTVAGKKYYLCCPGCVPAFNAAPAKYAKLADLRTERRNLQAKISNVNARIKEAEADTEGMLKEGDHGTSTTKPAATALYCAITDETITSAKDAAGSETVNGKTYYFCCPGCVTKFKADPAKYAAEADKRDAARVNK